jgi:hypothetical protein
MSSRRPLLLLAAVFAVACGRPQAADLGMSDSTYVKVLASLRAVADAPDLDSATRVRRRTEVLRTARLDAAAFERATAALADDPDRATALWRRIDERAMQLYTEQQAAREKARTDSLAAAARAARAPRATATSPGRR